MKTYFDSSVLVAGIIEEEEHHLAALKVLAECDNGFTSTHALAETFATLTSGRLENPLTPNEASHIINANFIERLEITELSQMDNWQAMQSSQSAGARGGAIFDMLHRRGRAERILTINVRHFQTFASDLKGIISLP